MIVVFVIPYGYHLDIGPGPDGIDAFIWEIYGIGDTIIIRFKPPSRLYLDYCGFRVITLIFILIYFQTKLKKIYLLLAGIIAELIPSMLSIYSILNLNTQGENLTPIVIPFPVLLIFVILLVTICDEERFSQKEDFTTKDD